MKYELIDLVDINQLQNLLDSFYNATGIASGIVSRDGTILTATAWRDLCTKFHRVNPKTKCRCTESDIFILEQLKNNNIIINNRCKNGLIDMGTPIVVEGNFLATIFSGQVFFEKPDKDYFRIQAKEFGFDEESYLKALDDIPIVTKEEQEKVLIFLKNLSEMISELGLRQLKILESQKRLMLSEERYKLSSFGSNDGLWDCCIKDSAFFASDRFIEILGYTQAEIDFYFPHFEEFIHPDDRDYFIEELHSHFKGHYSHFRQEVRIKTKSGKYIWVLIRGSAIWNEENIPVRMAGSLTDLSYTKDTEEQLKKEHAISKTILDHANVIICVWNLEGSLVQFNRYGEKISGYSAKEVLGYKWLNSIFKGKDGDEVLSFFQSLSLDIVSTSIEKSFYSKNGSIITILWNFQLIKNEDGSIKNIIGLGLDITKRKNEEKSLTEFFANISHELKTPLNIIFCTLQLIDSYNNKNSPYDNQIQILNCKKSIKQNCYRLLRLVNNLIDITKIDAKFLELNIIECNIITLIEDITLSVVPYVQIKRLELIFDTTIEEKFIYCDPDKIERIMLNLLSNAIKFSKTPGNIYVTLEDMEDGISISVKDTGIGIEPDKLNIIFERFKQVNKSFTREQEGSGIGLSLVKALVELHNGSIEVKSSYGQGSEFIVKLPSNVESYTEKSTALNSKCMNEYSNVEKVNIELSDIYFT